MPPGPIGLQWRKTQFPGIREISQGVSANLVMSSPTHPDPPKTPDFQGSKLHSLESLKLFL